jgi:hypothetical protein
VRGLQVATHGLRIARAIAAKARPNGAAWQLHAIGQEAAMKDNHNLGNIDRIVRLVLGVVLWAFAMIGQSIWLGILSAALLITAIAGFCPLYWMFGYRTQDAPR